jgi:hypothetical protein
VVLIHLQITPGLNGQIKIPVGGKEMQHMVEEGDSCVNVHPPLTI